MNIPIKKLKSGFAMPAFGLGTWQMGGRMERNPQNDDAADIRAIKRAIELGVTHIDTAQSYAGGHSEEIVAEAIKDFDRSKLFIVSKQISSDLTHDGILKGARESLKRLGTDYMDLFLLHSWNSDFPIEDSMKALDELVEQGLVKNIGVSNFSVEGVEQAQAASKNKIVCNQVHYNLEVREMERVGMLEFCQENDLFLVAYRPVQKGALLANPPQILLDMADKYTKTPAQVAINWLISQENVLVLAKTTNLEHLQDNLGATDWTMESEDIERLRKEYPNQQDISDVVALQP